MSGKICGRVVDKGTLAGPVVNAIVSLHNGTPCNDENWLSSTRTGERGEFEFRNLKAGSYHVYCNAFSLSLDKQGQHVALGDDQAKGWVEICLPVYLKLQLLTPTGIGEQTEPCNHPVAGRLFCVTASTNLNPQPTSYEFIALPDGSVMPTSSPDSVDVRYLDSGPKTLECRGFENTVDKVEAARAMEADEVNRAGEGRRSGGGNPTYVSGTSKLYASEGDRQMIGGNIGVRLERTRVHPTRDQALWIAIRNRTHAIGFTRYGNFINRVLQIEERERLDNPILERKLKDLGTNLHGVGAYEVLKIATEAFLLLECGIRIEEDRDPHRSFFHEKTEFARLGEPVSFEDAKAKLREYLGSPPQLPYITRVIAAAFPEWPTGTVCRDRVLTGGINEPCLIELIWSYWHEEGMLAQTMNAITRRFQNVRGPGDRDPIAHLEIDPLRPMNNIIWGIIQDESRRLSVKRRAYEYEHQYGLRLYGKSIGEMRPADSRSKFLEGFHNLLHLCAIFFKEDNDTTVIADGYPLLNALKEVHLLLAQGAHNQFGDMPWTARAEMMLQQYILSRPELRDFLQSRAMVPYKEAWMPQVDTMKTLQGWSDVTVTHFRDLAVYGEQILLSVRYGDWIAITDEDSAKNWARYWRPEIQGYLHAYRAATGVDLTNADTVDSTVPAVLLQKRLTLQHQRTR
jgi:hypothetical protein